MFRSKVLRPIAGLVLVTFTALTLQPLTAAAQLPPAPKRQEARSASGEERFSRTLVEIHEILKEVVPQAAMPHRQRGAGPEIPGKPGEKVLQAVGPKLRLESEVAKPRAGVDVTAKVKALRAKFKELKSLEGEVTKGFKETERHIRDKNLPAEILARHEQAVAEYEKRRGEFGTLMQRVEAADDGKGDLPGALAGLGEFMAKYPNDKTHTPTDPNNLPWGSPKPVTRAPYTSPSQFKTSRLFGEPVKVAQAGSLSGIGLPNTVLPATPMPADTAATEDVQITQAIRDLATSLGNKPVPIYNWVRNNIQFIPSYGSIQGSDMTLQTKRGNAFDTASLLIALFRAANIPARYVYGTIEVPADKAMNWVGGVTVPQAAMSLMGQGGIPNIGVAQGGQVKSIRMEHVWVEAFVDYVPSRGAVNRSPNTWVPMDGSYKQYLYTQGMNINTNVPFDAQALVTQVDQGAVVNDAEGWAQNINQAPVQPALTDYQTRLANFVSAQKANATVGDVLGTQTIAQENRAILLGTLPYKLLATGAKFQAVPDNLRWKFRYNLYADDTDLAFDSPFLSNIQSTASLAGKRITLSYSPATQGDQSTINSFLPQPHPDGTPILRSELPQTLPGYLIRLVPELAVAGQVIASGPAFSLGSELIESPAYFNPAKGQWESGEINRVIVGEYSATGLNLQGIAESQLTAVQTRLQAIKTRLEQAPTGPDQLVVLGGLTKDDLSGDLLFAGILSYLSTVDDNDRLAQRIDGRVLTYRLPSYGRFFAMAQPHFFFGVVRSVGFPALTMDVDFLRVQVEAKDEGSAIRLAFVRQMGAAASATEHAVPEQLFRDPTKPPTDPTQPNAVSAAKALTVAAAQGQRIYRLGPQNQSIHASTVASLGISADARDEIANALAAGLEVTVHQAAINVFGVSAAGYVILDPETGAGAYKVDGGANGAIFVTWMAFVAAGLAIAAAFGAGLVLAPTVALIFLALNIAALIFEIMNAKNDQQLMNAHFFATAGAVASLVALSILLLGGPVGAALVLLIASVWVAIFRFGNH